MIAESEGVVIAGDELTDYEQAVLERCEDIIEVGLATFVAVGVALMEIRESRLYRNGYGTFEDYCHDRWGISKTHVNRLVGAASVMGNLTPIGVILPANEAQARPLTRLEPEQQQEAWGVAVDTAPNGIVTASHVQHVVDEIRQKSAPHVAHNSGNYEWYTPIEYIEAARFVMGGIDVDPASSDFANRSVGADHYYTVEDDGRRHAWYGRVFMNPPYATGLIEDFCNALIFFLEIERTTEAVVLVNNATDTDWFQSLLDWCSAICFPNGRIKFLGPNGLVGAPLQGQAILYFGADDDKIDKFVSTFRRFGATGRFGLGLSGPRGDRP